METTATILHADLDAFYASVEQLLDPSLRGKPIAVGGGVVLAASYEAKAFGISGGMSGRRARELCPQLIFVGGHFKEYQRLGDAAISVLNDFTPLVERISIDEAFADVAGCTHLFGPPPEIASAIRRRVRAELGLPISIGVARTKHLAKIASQVAKPDGLLVVDPATELNFLHDRLRSAGEFTPRDAFVLHPYGRYCNANKFAGEVDRFEALDDVKRHYRIDEDRVVMRGFSMGLERLRTNPRRLAVGLALAEHLTLYPLCYFVDRYHPARGEPGIPPLLASPRAFVQATWRHALFGTILGRLAR